MPPTDRWPRVPGRGGTGPDIPKLMQPVLQAVRMGCWDYVAAEANGLSYAQFKRVMCWAETWEYAQERGIDFKTAQAELKMEHRAPSLSYVTQEFLDLCIEFRDGVIRARSEARMNAETQVFIAEPYKWLKTGPGRHRADRPGWSDQVEVVKDPTEALEIEPVSYQNAVSALAPLDAEWDSAE